MTRVGFGVAAMLTWGLIFASCDSLTGGSKKVVANEQVCADVNFLNMKLGEETKIVLDNSQHSEQQYSLGLVLEEFPIIITSGFREDAQVGPDFTTVRLFTLAGEEDEITVKPTFTGQYVATCQVVISRESGDTAVQQELTFQIVD
jgi:hypothetical protein